MPRAYFLSVCLLGALLGLRAQAQVATWPPPAEARIYVDGAAATAADLAQLAPPQIAHVSTLRGVAAQFFAHSPASSPVVVVTTTAASPENAAAQALDQQLQQATDAVVKMEEGDLPLPAQTYLTHEYAAYQLLDVDRVAPLQGAPPRYQATVVQGEQRAYLLFDAAGNFLEKL